MVEKNLLNIHIQKPILQKNTANQKVVLDKINTNVDTLPVFETMKSQSIVNDGQEGSFYENKKNLSVNFSF